jgi:hypothetical protein
MILETNYCKLAMLEYLELLNTASKPDIPPWARKIMIEVLTKMSPYMAIEDLKRLGAIRAVLRREVSRLKSLEVAPTPSPPEDPH